MHDLACLLGINPLFNMYFLHTLLNSACLINFDSLLLVSHIFILSEPIKHLFSILYLTTRLSAVSECHTIQFPS